MCSDTNKILNIRNANNQMQSKNKVEERMSEGTESLPSHNVVPPETTKIDLGKPEKVQYEPAKTVLVDDNKDNESDLKEKGDTPYTNLLISMLENIKELQQKVYALAKNYSQLVKIKSEKIYYVVSTRLLLEWYLKLLQDEDETIYFVSGIEIENYKILDILIPLQHKSKSTAHAVADIGSITEELIKNDEVFGHCLYAIAHTHPGRGINSIAYSDTDMQTQRRYEKAYESISIIFSRDGYFRFFSDKIDFDIIIYGKGVQSHGNHYYSFSQF